VPHALSALLDAAAVLPLSYQAGISVYYIFMAVINNLIPRRATAYYCYLNKTMIILYKEKGKQNKLATTNLSLGKLLLKLIQAKQKQFRQGKSDTPLSRVLQTPLETCGQILTMSILLCRSARSQS